MRFRLLSYVAAMLLLAGVLGANLTPLVYSENEFTIVDDVVPNNPHDGDLHYAQRVFCIEYGWPATAWQHVSWVRTDLPRAGDPVAEWLDEIPSAEGWYWRALSLNIAIGLAIPIAGLLLCEFVLRRYAPRRKVD